MSGSAQGILAKEVSVKIRVDGSQVAVLKTNKIGPTEAQFPFDELPLSENSFVELEFSDGADRLIVPARVTRITEGKITLEYEQTGFAFEHWLKTLRRSE